MKSFTLWLLALLILIPQVVLAQSTRLPSNLWLDYTLPSDTWQVSTETPEVAIKAMVVDLAHDKKKKGQPYDLAELRTSAVKFLKVNNLYIYKPKTEAYLMVSISPFNPQEGPATEAEVKGSIEWTVNSLAEHAEIKDLSPYRMDVEHLALPGLQVGHLINSNYPLFGDPHHFIGVIGYTHPYWVFLFYNDLARNATDVAEMEKIIRSMSFRQAK